MPAWLKKTLQFSASLVAGLFILWLVFRGQDLDTIKSTLASAKFEWILASGVAAIVAHGFRAARWAMLIEPLGTKPGFFLSFNAVMFGYLANLALPRMGEITRCGAISRKTKIPINGLIGTVIIERAIDMVLLVLITGLTVLFNLGLLQGPITRFSSRMAEAQLLGLPLWVYPLVLVPAGLFALYFYRKKLAHRLQHPFFVKLKGFIRGLLTGVKSIRELKHPFLFVGYSVGIWVGYYLMTYFCVFAFTSTSMLDPNEGLLILVAGSFGFVAPVQGGIGAYHAVISKLLVMLPGRGISTTDALSFATLTHAAQTILIMVVGFISVLFLFGLKSKHGTATKH
ncbi:MAG: lysylphosphatidylglycerol synthase transmembrane domain-containing protein [Sphingobacteriaceae bacterium]|nr:lysylphosphatidylglycerol synthase transmembrane domain-containing protein [Sphingobacteriaceae bacterium]